MDKLQGLPRQYREILDSIKPKDGNLQPSKQGGKTSETDFKDVIGTFIKDVDNMQKVSEQAIKDYATGEITDIHEVMIAAEEANLSFQLMMEVRNKLIESYREIMRMQS